MREVVSGLLWIGNAGDAEDVTRVLKTEIRAVVQLAIEEPAITYPRDVLYCRFPLLDGSGNDPDFVSTAIQTVASLLAGRIPLLMACSGGMSRSPVVAAAGISLLTGHSIQDCLQRITQGVPHDVNGALWNETLAILMTLTPPARGRSWSID